MPLYITLMNFTDQGIRNIKDSPNRVDADPPAHTKRPSNRPCLSP